MNYIFFRDNLKNIACFGWFTLVRDKTLDFNLRYKVAYYLTHQKFLEAKEKIGIIDMWWNKTAENEYKGQLKSP